MSASTLIRAAMDAGVALKFEDGKIKACGHADVVSLWAPRLREHKAALIEALQPCGSAAVGEASKQSRNSCFEPTATDPIDTADMGIPISQPTTKPTGQTYQEWVQTWRPMADAYHRHHFGCPICIAAGKGYGLHCGTGSVLWAAYSAAQTAAPTTQKSKGTDA